MQSITKTQLSERDRMVLDSIFSPNGVGNVDEVYNSASDDIDLTDEVDESVDTEEYKECTAVEVEAIKAAEAEDYEKALRLLSYAIERMPGRATLWNNRAQVHRFLNNDEGVIEGLNFTVSGLKIYSFPFILAALTDLTQAIKLSASKGRTGCQSLCQRGLLKRKQGDEDGARADFEVAAQLGSKFARNQLVELNPYAALCNQMLKEVMDKLK
jgi:tetratricopeptide (TPR) repeat protein